MGGSSLVRSLSTAAFAAPEVHTKTVFFLDQTREDASSEAFRRRKAFTLRTAACVGLWCITSSPMSSIHRSW